MKKEILKILLVFCTVSISINGICQKSTVDKRLINPFFGIAVGSNYSWYTNSIGKYNLDNLEIFAGYSSTLKIKNSINLNLALFVGLKKGKTYKRLSSFNITEPQYAFFEVDKFKRLLSYNHYFIDLPISVGYCIEKKIILTAGYSFRYYVPQENKQEYDFIFDNKFENGVRSGISFLLSNRLIIAGNFIFAIKNSYSSIIIAPDRQYSSTLKSRAFQVNLNYYF